MISLHFQCLSVHSAKFFLLDFSNSKKNDQDESFLQLTKPYIISLIFGVNYRFSLTLSSVAHLSFQAFHFSELPRTSLPVFALQRCYLQLFSIILSVHIIQRYRTSERKKLSLLMSTKLSTGDKTSRGNIHLRQRLLNKRICNDNPLCP